MKLKYPKIREKVRKDATIIISTLMDVTENPKDCFTNKEKRYMVEIRTPYGLTTSTAFSHDKKGTKQLLNFIKKECYLKC